MAVCPVVVSAMPLLLAVVAGVAFVLGQTQKCCCPRIVCALGIAHASANMCAYMSLFAPITLKYILVVVTILANLAVWTTLAESPMAKYGLTTIGSI